MIVTYQQFPACRRTENMRFLQSYRQTSCFAKFVTQTLPSFRRYEDIVCGKFIRRPSLQTPNVFHHVTVMTMISMTAAEVRVEYKTYVQSSINEGDMMVRWLTASNGIR